MLVKLLSILFPRTVRTIEWRGEDKVRNFYVALGVSVRFKKFELPIMQTVEGTLYSDEKLQLEAYIEGK